MKKLLLITTCLLFAGCTTVVRTVTKTDGSVSEYKVSSWMNRKSLQGLTLKDSDLEFSIQSLDSDQAQSLELAILALKAYLATRTGAP